MNDIHIFDFYFNLMIDRDDYMIMSPESIAKKPLMDKSLQKSKLDIFNLGLIILVFGLNIKPSNLYDQYFKSYKESFLKKSIEDFSGRYFENPFLCSIVKDFLNFDISQRPSIENFKKKYPVNTKLNKIRTETTLKASVHYKDKANQPISSSNYFYVYLMESDLYNHNHSKAIIELKLSYINSTKISLLLYLLILL